MRSHSRKRGRRLTEWRKVWQGNKKDTRCESETAKLEMWDGALNLEHEDKIETMTGPFKWDLVNASKGNGFSSSFSRTLKTHEITTAHKIWSKLDVPEKAACLAICGQVVGATWTETAPEQGMLDEEWRTAARRRLRLKTEESKMCQCGMLEGEKGDHTLACQRSPWRTRIHDRVRDSLARQLRRMGATVDLERVAPQWSKRYRDQSGTEKIRVARIDAVATIPGSNELQWLDVTIRRPTAQTNMEGSARVGGHAATQGGTRDNEEVREHKGDRPGYSQADQHRTGRENGSPDSRCASKLDDETG